MDTKKLGTLNPLGSHDEYFSNEHFDDASVQPWLKFTLVHSLHHVCVFFLFPLKTGIKE